MWRWVRYAMLALLVALSVGFVYARLTLFRGVPWRALRGHGVYAVEWGGGSRTIGASLDGDGLVLERNASEFSYRDKGDAPSWRFTRRAAPLWNMCGTGMDQYLPAGRFERYGIQCAIGTWVAHDGHRRSHFRAQSPHWLNASISGSWPVLALVSVVRRHRKHPQGHCQRCGYDLRATPDRCPECGGVPGTIGATA